MTAALLRSPRRILVIDDDSIDAFIHEEVLKQYVPQASVQTCMDSRSALTLLKTEPEAFDLILLDINMPVLSGWDLLDALDDAQISTPVLMVSSSQHPRDYERVKASDLIHAFIPKPLTSEKLETYLAEPKPQ